MEETIWHYKLSEALTNRNAGYSMWGFGTKAGTEFFIKQFLSPKFPIDDTESSPERLEKKLRECEKFVKRKTEIYEALNAGSDGNDVRVREFFRVKSRFYIAMDKVDALNWTIDTIAQLPQKEIKRLCAIIAHAVAGLHQKGLVHADLKHENILYTQLPSGTITAKVIDFDNSFLEAYPPEDDEEIVGDFNYFAPEVCAKILGQTQRITCKADIFALGILFHQYFSGALPEFSGEKCSCPGESVLRGRAPRLHKIISKDLMELILSMLNADPEKRPSAWQVFERLRSTPVSVKSAGQNRSPFRKAGNLL